MQLKRVVHYVCKAVNREYYTFSRLYRLLGDQRLLTSVDVLRNIDGMQFQSVKGESDELGHSC